jgi:2-(acetamidomethylene)succinate hydrolase
MITAPATDAIAVERLETSRLTVSARVAGEGELLLLLHGITAGAVVWDPVIANLSRDHRVVAIDQRGHGATDHPESGYSAQDYVDDVAAVLDVIGPARAVIGHSLGGRNAILAGAAMPERIGAVVSIDYAATIEPGVFSALREARAAGEGPLPDVESVHRAIRARSSLLPDDAVERRAHNLYVEQDGGFRPVASAAAIGHTLESMDADLVPALRDTRMPTMLMRGSESPFLSEAAFMRSLWLRGDLAGAIVSGADHFVPEQQPDEVAELIRRFVA